MLKSIGNESNVLVLENSIATLADLAFVSASTDISLRRSKALFHGLVSDTC